MSARVLIVGAGAVGQVYGAHLHAAGAEVGVLVKPRYAREARAGFHLEPTHEEGWDWIPSTVLDAPVEAALSRWDQVWLCVSSTALDGPWLDELLRAVPDAIVVSLQPRVDDQALLRAKLPEGRLVTGLIGFSAWPAPLPGQQGPQGTGFWFPPVVKSRFSGPEAAVDTILDLLKRGGLPADRSADAARDGALGSAILISCVAGLEVVGWGFTPWRRDPISRVSAAAAREILGISGAIFGIPVWPVQLLARRRLLSLGLRLAARVAPIPFETFLRVHFTKVGDQTRAMLASWIHRGRELGMPVEALSELARRLPRT